MGVEQTTQRVSGVKALAIKIDVKLAGSGKRNDADIALAAEQALQWLTYVPKGSVKVMVEKGLITLSGDAEGGSDKPILSDKIRQNQAKNSRCPGQSDPNSIIPS